MATDVTAEPGIRVLPDHFGYRPVYRTRPDGSKEEVGQLPLTLDDLLYPQDGDVHLMASRHERECAYLGAALRANTSKDAGVLVLVDCKLDWGIDGLGNPCPDVAVFRNVRDPKRDNWGTFPVAEQGARPALIIEVVSPEARVNDVYWKMTNYYRAGVRRYVIIDRERDGDPPRVVAYRHRSTGWEEMFTDDADRLDLEEFNLWIYVEGDRLVCQNSVTGSVYLDAEDANNGLFAAQAEATEAARRADEEKARADEEKARAEAAAARADEAQRIAAEEKQRADALAARLAELEAKFRDPTGANEQPTP